MLNNEKRQIVITQRLLRYSKNIFRSVLAMFLVMALLLTMPYFPFNYGIAEASSTQHLWNLEIGDRVVDNSWQWEYRTGVNYTGYGVTKPVVWIVVAKNHYGAGSGVTLLSEELIGAYCFDNSTNRGSEFGSNHWGSSGTPNASHGLRPWLNSTGIHSKEGFYDAFSSSFKSSIVTVSLPNKEWRYGNTYTTNDKVFIPSNTELGDTEHFWTYQIGSTYDYFSGVSSSDRKARLGTTFWNYWTRSPYSDHLAPYPIENPIDTPYMVCYVEDSGKFGGVYASHPSEGVRPALNLRFDTQVSETPNAAGIYEIMADSSSPPYGMTVGSRIQTTNDLKVRTGPTIGAKETDLMWEGNRGTIINGPIHADGHKWWEITYDVSTAKYNKLKRTGWSAETYLQLSPMSPPLPHGFEDWAAQAISWAQAREGSYGWIRYCARFVANAFMLTEATIWQDGKSAGGNADDLARELYRFNQENEGWKNAPKGALIFFDKTDSNRYGHVAIYLGDGKIIHSYGSVRNGDTINSLLLQGTNPDIGRYIGWSYPPERWRPGNEVAVLPLLKVGVASPVSLRTYDSENRITGIVGGEIIEQIPSSAYNSETNEVIINPALDSYRFEVHGNDSGNYSLRLMFYNAQDLFDFTVKDIATTFGETHFYEFDWDALAMNEQGITIKIDDEVIITSIPNYPVDPFPVDHDSTVAINTSLSWHGGDGIDQDKEIYYELYLGTEMYSPITEILGPFSADQIAINYNPGLLKPNTTYFWRIVAKDQYSITTEGPLWQFITGNHIEADVKIEPDTIQLSAHGRWITAYIEINGFEFNDEDVQSIQLLYNDNSISAHSGKVQKNGQLMVKFDRNTVAEWLNIENGFEQFEELTVTGEVEGITFVGNATVRVISPQPRGRNR